MAERLNDIAPSSTLAITAQAKALKGQGKPVVSLAAGEPDFATPKVVADAIRESLESGFTKYTPTSGLLELKEAVTKKIKRDQNLDIDASHVVISCGAKHALYNLFQALINPGDEVILPKPYWVSYPEMIRMAGGIPVYCETADTDFLMKPDRVKGLITSKTKVLLINSPSNPTGAVLEEDDLKALAQIIEEKNLYCISDEIYEYYVFDGKKHVSIANLIKDWKKHVAIVNGVSKSHSMTGLRIGYTVADPALIKKIGMIQDHSTSNPTSISQKGAIQALQMEKAFFDKLSIAFQDKRDMMLEKLREIKKLKAFCPQGAFYLFVSVKDTGLKPHDFSMKLLEEAYVATIPGEGFGSEEYIRLSFAASKEDIAEGLKRMKSWVEKLK